MKRKHHYIAKFYLILGSFVKYFKIRQKSQEMFVKIKGRGKEN